MYKGRKVLFNFNELKILKSDGKFINVVTCNILQPVLQVSSANYNGKITLGFIIENNSVVTYSITLATYNSSEKSLKYFDEDFNLLYSVNIDEVNKQVSIESSGLVNSKAPGCGQSTMNCINHHYSQNGWWSVGLWIATAFYPGVGVAVAAGCGLSCCLKIGCPGN